MVEAVHKRITLSGPIFAGQRRQGAGARWGESRRSDSDLGDFSDRAQWLVITGILFAKVMLLKLIPADIKPNLQHQFKLFANKHTPLRPLNSPKWSGSDATFRIAGVMEDLLRGYERRV